MNPLRPDLDKLWHDTVHVFGPVFPYIIIVLFTIALISALIIL